MNAQIIFYIILFLVVADYIVDQYVDYLNRKNFSAKVPEILADVYQPDEYKKNQNYLKDNSSFDFIHSSFSLALIIIMLLFNGFSILNNWLLPFNLNPALMGTVYLLILMLVSSILDLPFSWKSTFGIEEKYGFNKSTKKTFIFDTLKSLALTVVMGGLLIYLLFWLYYRFENNFWLYAWAALSFFSLFMATFYSNIIVPLFNKQSPLEEGELRNAIEAFSEKVDFKLKNIFVIDGSKRSTKANAYFAGLGTQKRIVLYDTLINDLSTEEIVAVLAHEIGHYKHKHIIKSLIISFIYSGIMLYLFSIFAKNQIFTEALGVHQEGVHIALISFGILYSPISMIIGIGMNIFSRKNEFEADKFAKTNYEANYLISGLKKLSQKSLSNLTPHNVYVFLNYSHPDLYQRIKALSNE
jgi:STE24 endopeptidase